MSRTSFANAYSRLKTLYAIEDPWQMTSPKEQFRFAETVRLLREVRPRYQSLLELGCGEGHQSVFFETITDRLYGIELSKAAIARARRRCPAAEFRNARLEELRELLKGQRFDIITACEVLYYSRDIGRILEDLKKLTDTIFVSNYGPRAEAMQSYFDGEGWRRLPAISFEDTHWQCMLWQATGSCVHKKGGLATS